MNNSVYIDRSLITYVVSFLKTIKDIPLTEEQENIWRSGINGAILEMDHILYTQQSGANSPGQKQIHHNPNRTDVGMGAILNTNSEFL